MAICNLCGCELAPLRRPWHLPQLRHLAPRGRPGSSPEQSSRRATTYRSSTSSRARSASGRSRSSSARASPLELAGLAPARGSGPARRSSPAASSARAARRRGPKACCTTFPRSRRTNARRRRDLPALPGWRGSSLADRERGSSAPPRFERMRGGLAGGSSQPRFAFAGGRLSVSSGVAMKPGGCGAISTMR